MLTMIRDGHRQVGIYQQKVSQIGSRHYSRVARESIDPSSFLFSIAFHRRRGRFSLTSQRIDTTFRSPVGFIASTWNVQFLQKELYSHENKRFKFQRINDKFSSILFHFDRLRDRSFSNPRNVGHLGSYLGRIYSIPKHSLSLEVNHCLLRSRASRRSLQFPDETTLSMIDGTDYKGSRCVRRPDVGLTIRPYNLIAAINHTRREITRGEACPWRKIWSREMKR